MCLGRLVHVAPHRDVGSSVPGRYHCIWKGRKLPGSESHSLGSCLDSSVLQQEILSKCLLSSCPPPYVWEYQLDLWHCFRWCALDCGYVGRAGPSAVSEKPAEGSFAVHRSRTGLLSSAEPELGTHSHGLEHLSDPQPIAIALVLGG